MRSVFILLLFLCFNRKAVNAQQPPAGPPPSTLTKAKNAPAPGLRTLSEICGNSVDDDSNGLMDCEDFSCYFNPADSACNCVSVNTIWVCSGSSQLYWINPQTGVENHIGSMDRVMTDISWTPQGKLYGVDAFENKIWEIDPSSGQTTFVMSLTGYDFSNAMISDGNGNLYLASRLAFAGNTQHIIRVNPLLGSITMIADLTPSGSLSAGDLAFSNGQLYLACINNLIARINIYNGTVVNYPITGLPFGANIFGIIAKSDGSLYLSDISQLYQLNTSTMQATLFYSCTSPGINIWGMANYNDYCLAPVCRAEVSISIESNAPYCSYPGVSLKATGTGITGDSTYRWTLPDGSVLNTQSIIARDSGLYIVRYADIPDTCGSEDTLLLHVIKIPDTRLGEDTSLCPGSQITLSSSNTEDVNSYLWQDGSTGAQLTVSQPGLYWLQTGNSCGNSIDSIVIYQKAAPRVSLGPDREVCRYDTLHIKNHFDLPGYRYRWIDNSSGNYLVIDSPGIYWVDVSNDCGTLRDSIRINPKTDDCECFLQIPTGFTPNQDGRNDLFRVSANCPVSGELFIYNRWGQLIFYTGDLQQGWNGKYHQLLQGTGVFVYQVKYRYLFRPGNYFKKGTFLLIR